MLFLIGRSTQRLFVIVNWRHLAVETLLKIFSQFFLSFSFATGHLPATHLPPTSLDST